jgi:hypothetical protein
MSSESNPLLTPSGCLSEQGLQLLRRSPPGQGPPELAAHLVACGRCQRRLLESDRAPGQPRRRRRARSPSFVAAGLIAAVGLLLALIALALAGLR